MRKSIYVCIVLLLVVNTLISCHTTSHKATQKKQQDEVIVKNDKEYFSIDFSRTSDVGTIFIANPDLFSIAGKEFTVEAWIKKKSNSSLNGGIFSRFMGGGLSLYVKENEPKFSVILNVGGTSTFTAASGVSLNVNSWTHVAGVLVNENHSTIIDHPQCPRGLRPKGKSGGEAETPHMDIYINGTLHACASTWDSSNKRIHGPQFAPDDDLNSEGLRQIFIGMLPYPGGKIDGLDSTTRFDGAVDEVRFWTVARTRAEIQQCMKQILGYSEQCKIDSTKLKGYWPLVKGTGTDVDDKSGNNISGSAFSPFGTKWNGGWTGDSPF